MEEGQSKGKPVGERRWGREDKRGKMKARKRYDRRKKGFKQRKKRLTRWG